MHGLNHFNDAKAFIQHIQQQVNKQIWYVVAWGSLNGFLTGLGILLILPLLSLTTIEVPNSVDSIGFRFPDNWSFGVQLTVVLGLYFLLISLSVWVNRKATLASVTLLQKYVKRLRDELFQHIFQSSLADVWMDSQSRYSSLFTVEIGRISLGVQGIVNLVTTLLVALPQILIAFYLSPGLTTYVMIGGILLFIGLYRSMKRVRQLGHSLQHLNLGLQQAVQDQLNGLKEIKSYGAEVQHVADFQRTTDQIQQNLIDYTSQQTRADSFYKVGAALLISLFLGIGLLAFHYEMASLLVILLIFSRLWPAFSSAQRHIQSVLTALPSFEVYQHTVSRLHQEETGEPSEALMFEQQLRFEKVSYRYPNHEQDALKEIDVTIQAGTMVALTGPSGAGKSTMVDLLLQFIEPDSGRIVVDGQPLTTADRAAWLSSIAYVPQHPYLFYGTIEENIRKWNPDLSDIELEQALQMADATFVYELPDGLQTRIGDFGHSLSGGERQRVVLARALAKRPRLLIMDEATRAVDEAQESKIFETLQALTGEMTIVYITHRRDIARLADQEICLTGGRIVERGEVIESV